MGGKDAVVKTYFLLRPEATIGRVVLLRLGKLVRSRLPGDETSHRFGYISSPLELLE